MYYELNKREKKIARALIDKGIDIAYTKALRASAVIIEKWHSKNMNNKDAYLTLFKEIDKHDDSIARRYNGLGGSKWLACVADLFAEKVISEEDIQDFSEETKQLMERKKQ